MENTTELDTEEANALDHLASSSGMDCWFMLTDGDTRVLDLENNASLSLEEALPMFCEGVLRSDVNALETAERDAYLAMVSRLGLPQPQ